MDNVTDEVLTNPVLAKATKDKAFGASLFEKLQPAVAPEAKKPPPIEMPKPAAAPEAKKPPPIAPKPVPVVLDQGLGFGGQSHNVSGRPGTIQNLLDRIPTPKTPCGFRGCTRTPKEKKEGGDDKDKDGSDRKRKRG